ncbi:DHA2 family efflux MFS transporter permease subunit [Umezawaea sp. NPDC059074]|uniref:DHA2 family efflux MFS transporter permease subunit n=1 Tax=Umezawaea sp. NPDC059074 TaxID=3346716 RepID=UPI0036B3DF4C
MLFPSQRRVTAPHHPNAVLLVLCLAAFMASLDVFIVNVAFEDIGRDFGGVRLADLSWILNAYTIVYAALLVPAGRIADRFGRKGTFLVGLGLFTAASAACAATDGVWWLVVFRVVQSVGAALLTPSSLGLVIASAPAHHRVRSVRIWAASGAFAAALGPVIGGLLVAASWRWVFVVNVPVGIAALVATALVVPRSRDEDAKPLPDVLGAGLLIVAVGALTLGLVQGSDWGWTDSRILTTWVVTLVALGGFLASSARHATPVIDPVLLRVRSFAWSNATALLFSVPFAAGLLANILWLQQVWHYSPIRTGFAVAVGPAMVPLFTVVAHRLAHRVPTGHLVAAGSLLYGLGGLYTSLVVTAEPHYATAMLPSLLIGGAGVGLALPTILSSATADLPPSQSATGSAIVNMSRQLGTALGVSVLVAILGNPTTYDVAHTVFQHAWWTFAVVAALAAAVAPAMTHRA